MPNHITNKVSAPAEALRSLINESGKIDFNMLLPFKGAFNWDFISGAAEEAAQLVCGNALHENQMIASLQKCSRDRVNVLGLDDESFEQFVQMVRNKRTTGHFHKMDFAIDTWGTKWNAYAQMIDIDGGMLSFDTAWSCPEPVLEALSAKHPEAEIILRFADEDLGSNCGMITFKGGSVVVRDAAGSWEGMSSEQRQRWTQFACDLTGRDYEPDEAA